MSLYAVCSKHLHYEICLASYIRDRILETWSEDINGAEYMCNFRSDAHTSTRNKLRVPKNLQAQLLHHNKKRITMSI
jgi:hypothetical protein